MEQAFDVVIVGGGQGGAQAAASLRQNGFAGSIAIVGEEADPPYDRPPLSKEYLAGDKTFERMVFRTREAWREIGVELLLGRRATAVDPGARQVELEDGAVIGYERLVWACGGSPRRLSCAGHDLQGVHSIRTRADVDQLRAELPGIEEAVVVGGGYIGLEAAAALCKLGKSVTLVEAQERVLARVAGETLSRFFEAEHQAHGVSFHLAAAVESVEGKNGAVSGVKLHGGAMLPARLVIVGIGVIPAVEPLRAAGAVGTNGVLVDSACATSLPGVYAIGDCAEHPNAFSASGFARLESVQNANDQAVVAAKAICGAAAHYDAVPWFWSNQFDLRLQTVGLSTGHDEVVIRGDPSTRSFSCIYLRGERVLALDCVNAVRDYAQGKTLVQARARIPAADLADTSTSLRDLLARTT